MAAQYPFDIDVTKPEGQAEILQLWSKADLTLGLAAWIMKLTQREFLDLAERRGVAPPSNEAIAQRSAELEARMRPLVQRQERDRVRRDLSLRLSETLETSELMGRVVTQAESEGSHSQREAYSGALDHVNAAMAALRLAIALLDDGGRNTEANAPESYTAVASRVLDDLEPVKKRPDYYLTGFGDVIFNHVNPRTVHDVIWSWSQGYLTSETARVLLNLSEDESLEEVARDSDVPLPTEEALSPEEAAEILGDEPLNGDLTFHVRRRIEDARLPSYRRSDVESRRKFEDREKKLQQQTDAEPDHVE